MRICTVTGWWSTNIGNSFFQLSAEYILKKISDDVILIPDAQAYWNVKEGNPKNAFDFLANIKTDVLVLHGPIFRKEYDRTYLSSLKELKKKGVKLVCLAAGMMHYDEESVRYYNQWLKEAPFDLITTRDSHTYHSLKPSVKNIYDGIDVAFFINDAIKSIELDCKDFVVYNFDQIDEPFIINCDDEGQADFQFEGKDYYLKGFKRDEPLSYYKKLKPFVNSVFRKKYQDKFDAYDIIRTDHRFNPFFSKKNYKASNSFSSDNPYGYLNIYANARITFSNRVHACVATLANGNPAMYFSNSKRSKLFDRVNLSDIMNKPVSLNREYILEEKEKLFLYIKSHL